MIQNEKVNVYFGSKEAYEFEKQYKRIDENALYFIEGILYSGYELYSQDYKKVSSYPSIGQKNYIYINTTNSSVAIWDDDTNEWLYLSKSTVGVDEAINELKAEIEELSEITTEEIKTNQSELESHAKNNVVHITNDERELWNDKYTKVEIDNKFSAFETDIDWKEAVNTYNDIVTTYPNPKDGWTVNVKDTDYTYRYNGTEWVAISANATPKATNEVDGLLSKEDHAKYEETYNQKHSHNNKSILDTITSAIIETWNSAVTHISDTVKHITSTERTNWNAKLGTEKIAANLTTTEAGMLLDATMGKQLAETDASLQEQISTLNSNIEDFNDNTKKIDEVLESLENPEHDTGKQAEVEELASGESLKVALRKLAKAVADYISHKADKVAHTTAEERASWKTKIEHLGLESQPIKIKERGWYRIAMIKLPGAYGNETTFQLGRAWTPLPEMIDFTLIKSFYPTNCQLIVNRKSGNVYTTKVRILYKDTNPQDNVAYLDVYSNTTHETLANRFDVRILHDFCTLSNSDERYRWKYLDEYTGELAEIPEGYSAIEFDLTKHQIQADTARIKSIESLDADGNTITMGGLFTKIQEKIDKRAISNNFTTADETMIAAAPLVKQLYEENQSLKEEISTLNSNKSEIKTYMTNISTDEYGVCDFSTDKRVISAYLPGFIAIPYVSTDGQLWKFKILSVETMQAVANLSLTIYFRYYD